MRAMTKPRTKNRIIDVPETTTRKNGEVAVDAKPKAASKEKGKGTGDVRISRPEFVTLNVEIIGTTGYMQLRFSQKAIDKMMAKHTAGTQSNVKKVREARDFDDDCEQAKHKMADGTCGIPCSAFRNAMISACRLVGFKMTIAKLSVWVMPDGADIVDGTPLVRIHGTPERSIMSVRNATGVCDLRSRPLWKEWSCKLRVTFDLAQFSSTDVVNLLMRAGMQVGVGEGRPDSRNSAGLDFGRFVLGDAIGEATTETGR